jgi:F-type H+-transporting ATPase subunit b
VLIDWFTVGAQVLNFVVLVWLMKRFLYKPIRDAIDARERLIATELADAAAKKAEAHEERDEFQRKNLALDQQRAALWKAATDEANAERQRLVGEARKAADALSASRQETLRTDARDLGQAVLRRTQQEVFAIARKALSELATASLEERLCAVFTRRLRELDGPAKAVLASALEAATDLAIVRSAFELPSEQRAVIQNALNETFSAEVRVRFETAPDLVSGIELATSGQKVGWSIAGYLASLEKGIEELLHGDETQARHQASARSEDKPASEPEPNAESKPEVHVAPRPEARPAPRPEERRPVTRSP